MPDIAEIVYRKEYRNYCRSLYNGRYLWEDLFQEFVIKVLEQPKELIERLYNAGDEIVKYCFTIIKNLFYQREKNYSPLRELANDSEIKDIPDNETKEQKVNVTEILDQYPTLEIKNMREYCQDNRISYQAMKQKNSRIKRKLKAQYGNAQKT